MTNLIQAKNHLGIADAAESKTPVLFKATDSYKEDGFSLIEALIALVILLVAVLGVFATFAYAINYNSGNSSRAQALAVLQQEVELVRSAKFTPIQTDNYPQATPDDGRRDITGGVKPVRIVTSANNYSFKVRTTVVDISSTLKEITVTVTLNNPTPGWQTSVPATVVLRRVQAN